MIPGSNVLKMALSVIASQTITYYRAIGRTTNALGQFVTEYDTGTFIKGSFQPVARSLYQSYGLDFNKTYYTFYAPQHLMDVNRNVSGDQIAYNSSRFQCESSNDWYVIDGWVGMLCILISPQNQTVYGFDHSGGLNFDNGDFVKNQ